MTESEKRNRYGLLAGIFGVFCNLVLSVIKIIVGLTTGVVSISADAVNNLSDMFSSIVTIFGFKLSGKPADKEHPYGHGRMEYVSGFIVSISVIVIAIELLKTSVDHIFHENKMDVGITTIFILICAIILKFIMAYVYAKISKIISSRALKASAVDSISDCITTTVALISVIVKLATGMNIDGYAGTIVSLLVIYSGIKSCIDTINMLLGEAPSAEAVNRIKEIVLDDPHVCGVHDLRVHEYGPSCSFASLHAEIDQSIGFFKAHEIIEGMEKRIVSEGIVSEVTIHMDPVDVDDKEILSLKRDIKAYLRDVCEDADVHDLHIIDDKLMFDIQFPYGYNGDMKREEEKLIEALKLDDKYEVIIHTEKG